jgi:hypothetical protein
MRPDVRYVLMLRGSCANGLDNDVALVVQHAFENLEEADKRDLVTEVLDGFDRVVCDQWGSA